MPEVSEADLKILQRSKELVDNLWNDPAHGSAVRKKAGEMYPDVRTPEADLEPIIAPVRAEAEALRAELQAERDERRKEREEAAQRAQEQSLADRLAAARDRFHLTDVGFEMTVAKMKETGNFSDPMAAAALIVADNPPPKDPSGYLGPQQFKLFANTDEAADERLRLLLKDPQGAFLDAEFKDFLTDPDQYIRDAGIAA
jgi:hypothetical protein